MYHNPQNFCRICTHNACTFIPILSEWVPRRRRISTLSLHTRDRTWPKLPPVLSTALQNSLILNLLCYMVFHWGHLHFCCEGKDARVQSCKGKSAKIKEQKWEDVKLKCEDFAQRRQKCKITMADTTIIPLPTKYTFLSLHCAIASLHFCYLTFTLLPSHFTG